MKAKHSVLLTALACALMAPASYAATGAPASLYPSQILPRGTDGNDPRGLGQMVTADFNGDGITDLAVSDWSREDDGTGTGTDIGHVWIYLRKADGSYETPVPYATERYPAGLAAADLNGDGKLDLVTGNNIGTNANQMSVLLGNGDGTFQAVDNYSPDTSTTWYGRRVAVGDVTGDGKLDVVLVSTNDSGKIFVVPVNADGTLDVPNEQTLTQTSNWAAGNSLALADINGDGTLDVVTEDGAKVNVFYGQATLTASANDSIAVAASDPSMAAGDFNEDSKPDVVVTNYDSSGNPSLHVLLNNGSTLTDAHDYSFPVDVGIWGPIGITDVDGDGHLDLFVDDDSCAGDASYILYGQGDGSFTGPAPVPGGECGMAAATIDGGNGLSNLLTGMWWDYGTITEARNLGNRKFYTYTTYPYAYADGVGTLHGDSAWDLAVGDFNGDGYPDAVTANDGDHSFSLLLNDGHGGFKAPTADDVHTLPAGTGLRAVAVADVNGDGKLDVIAPPAYSSDLYVYLGDGNGGFSAIPVPSAVNNGPISGVAVGDIDGDGKPDLALAEFSSGVQICKGDATGAFACNVYSAVAVSTPSRVALADLTGNGKLDLIVSSQSQTADSLHYQTFVFTGDGNGAFSASDTLWTADGSPYDNPWDIAVGDLNGDGKPDIALGTTGASAYVYEGNGDGTFAPFGGGSGAITTGYSDYGKPRAVTLADVNGDGKLDLVADNDEEATVGVLLGNGDGSFGAPSVFASGDGGYGVAVADLDGDGQPDIVSLNQGYQVLVSSTVAVYLHNHAPAVQSLALTTHQGTPVAGTLDTSDAEQNGVTFSVATAPAHGTMSAIDGNGAFTYTPTKGYVGADSFTVTASDGMNAAAPTTVNVQVKDQAPVAKNGTLSTGAGAAATGKLSASDADNDALTFSIVKSPAHGSVKLTDAATGAYRYTPASGYSGTDSFTFKANDGALDSNSATVGVTVQAQAGGNTPPPTSGGGGGFGLLGLLGLGLLALKRNQTS